MSITSGGIFSGLDTKSLIAQLLSIEARPKVLAQTRIVQLQGQQAAFLDINTKLSALKSAAAAFRTAKTFDTKTAVSSKPEALAATASPEAAVGSYSFLVDRLVSTQQMLSRGFADRSGTGIGLTGISVESAKARLDRDTPLSELNGGVGVERGKIVLSVQGGSTATVDLSKAATVGEVLDAINNAGGVNITATVQGGKIVLTQKESQNITVTSAFGSGTAASLGIQQTTFAAPTVTGQNIATIGAATALHTLNDGNGIFIGNQVGTGVYDFQIVVTSGGTPTTVGVNLGDVYDAEAKKTASAVTTADGVLKRINEALTAAGFTDVKASIKTDGSGFQIVDGAGTKTLRIVDNPNTLGNTAKDLGFTTDADTIGTVTGARILAGLNSTLASTLHGGAGLTGGGAVSITGRDGVVYAVSFDPAGSLSDIIREFEADTGGKITARLNAKGTGLEIQDKTGSTSGNLIVAGASAASLGIATDPAGVAASIVTGTNLQKQYVTLATSLASYNGGKGVGTGQFKITDSLGGIATIDIGGDEGNLAGIVREINARGLRAKARINDNGDGLEIYEDIPVGGTAGAVKMKIEDVTGTVAAKLNIAGQAKDVGADNVINGSLERKVELAATDSLDQVIAKLNAAGAGVAASVIRDGSGGTPFRLSLTASSSGSEGRVIIDTGSVDIGLTTLDAGQDARVFYGGTDPAKAVLLTSSTNTLDDVITGVSIDLLGTDKDPITLNVTRNTGAVEEAINTFIAAYNAVLDRVATQTRFVPDTGARGPLLGDSTIIQLRQAMDSTIQGRAVGVTGDFQSLAAVGLTVGEGGKLKLDSTALRQALEQDPQGVADLFAARVIKPKEPIPVAPGVTTKDPQARDEFSSLGVLAQIEEMAGRFTNSTDGIITRRGKTLGEQVALQRARIEQFDAKLATKRGILERQFMAMEQAIGQLQSQQSQLGSISRIAG